ncbi:inner membrane protein [Luteibacter sp. Sphag1AF]|uniref:cell envelope integrity protein CreD n=1 Tax=Luteibacter sp. Sphag1AF TaxID=2587031 RepID=UPI00160E4DD9|nr:cell envelope integrity protein CreD [Luteibacter sp. Sphag1AF]MBB3225789.1 inner membrane protein [Luteibacter sp. Sphag1AF]
MFAWTQTVTAKVIGVGLLALLMLIPLGQISGLVREREALRVDAAANIAKGWGGAQTVGGLVLAIPTQEQVNVEGTSKVATRYATEIVLADTLTTRADLAVQKRSYGMYEVPVYEAEVQISGRILPADIRAFDKASNATWIGKKAELRLLISDTQGLREVSEVTVNGKPQRFASSTERVGGFPVVALPIDLDALGDTPIDFKVTARLAGTESLDVLPLARSNVVEMKAPWPDPSFTGALLPATRDIRADGFSANWRMLDLNRNFGQHWNETTDGVDRLVAASSFGVELYQPASVYQQNLRANKYALLFIALTFVAFFLFEVLKRLRVHPVQYLLVGGAMATFYVLLLALSEQIGFGRAYLLASSAVVLIVGGYATAVLRARRAGLLLGGVLALVYAVLYGLIGAEQYALLIGSVVLLAVVATLMFLTRRIDWYAYGSKTTDTP